MQNDTNTSVATFIAKNTPHESLRSLRVLHLSKKLGLKEVICHRIVKKYCFSGAQLDGGADGGMADAVSRSAAVQNSFSPAQSDWSYAA